MYPNTIICTTWTRTCRVHSTCTSLLIPMGQAVRPHPLLETNSENKSTSVQVRSRGHKNLHYNNLMNSTRFSDYTTCRWRLKCLRGTARVLKAFAYSTCRRQSALIQAKHAITDVSHLILLYTQTTKYLNSEHLLKDLREERHGQHPDYGKCPITRGPECVKAWPPAPEEESPTPGNVRRKTGTVDCVRTRKRAGGNRKTETRGI